jgi:hypothetical protein
VLEKTLLRRLVVEWCHRQYGGISCQVAVAEFFDQRVGAVATHSENEGNTSGYFLLDKLADLTAFVRVESRCLAGCAEHHDIIGFAVDYVRGHTRQRLEVYLFGRFEGGDQCHTHSSQTDSFHKVGYSEYYAKLTNFREFSNARIDL